MSDNTAACGQKVQMRPTLMRSVSDDSAYSQKTQTKPSVMRSTSYDSSDNSWTNSNREDCVSSHDNKEIGRELKAYMPPTKESELCNPGFNKDWGTDWKTSANSQRATSSMEKFVANPLPPGQAVYNQQTSMDSSGSHVDSLGNAESSDAFWDSTSEQASSNFWHKCIDSKATDALKKPLINESKLRQEVATFQDEKKNAWFERAKNTPLQFSQTSQTNINLDLSGKPLIPPRNEDRLSGNNSASSRFHPPPFINKETEDLPVLSRNEENLKPNVKVHVPIQKSSSDNWEDEIEDFCIPVKTITKVDRYVKWQTCEKAAEDKERPKVVTRQEPQKLMGSQMEMQGKTGAQIGRREETQMRKDNQMLTTAMPHDMPKLMKDVQQQMVLKDGQQTTEKTEVHKLPAPAKPQEMEKRLHMVDVVVDADKSMDALREANAKRTMTTESLLKPHVNKPATLPQPEMPKRCGFGSTPRETAVQGKEKVVMLEASSKSGTLPATKSSVPVPTVKASVCSENWDSEVYDDKVIKANSTAIDNQRASVVKEGEKQTALSSQTAMVKNESISVQSTTLDAPNDNRSKVSAAATCTSIPKTKGKTSSMLDKLSKIGMNPNPIGKTNASVLPLQIAGDESEQKQNKPSFKQRPMKSVSKNVTFSQNEPAIKMERGDGEGEKGRQIELSKSTSQESWDEELVPAANVDSSGVSTFPHNTRDQSQTSGVGASSDHRLPVLKKLSSHASSQRSDGHLRLPRLPMKLIASLEQRGAENTSGPGNTKSQSTATSGQSESSNQSQQLQTKTAEGNVISSIRARDTQKDNRNTSQFTRISPDQTTNICQTNNMSHFAVKNNSPDMSNVPTSIIGQPSVALSTSGHPSGISDAVSLPSGIPNASSVSTEIPNTSRLPTPSPDASTLPSGQPNASDLPTGVPNASGVQAGVPNASSVSTGMPNTSGLPTTIPGASTLPTGVPSVLGLPAGQPNASSLPAGLPPHLIQAYLQYLQQSSMETAAASAAATTAAAATLGLMPGVVGMPIIPPLGTALFPSVMPITAPLLPIATSLVRVPNPIGVPNSVPFTMAPQTSMMPKCTSDVPVQNTSLSNPVTVPKSENPVDDSVMKNQEVNIGAATPDTGEDCSGQVSLPHEQTAQISGPKVHQSEVSLPNSSIIDNRISAGPSHKMQGQNVEVGDLFNTAQNHSGKESAMSSRVSQSSGSGLEDEAIISYRRKPKFSNADSSSAIPGKEFKPGRKDSTFHNISSKDNGEADNSLVNGNLIPFLSRGRTESEGNVAININSKSLPKALLREGFEETGKKVGEMFARSLQQGEAIQGLHIPQSFQRRKETTLAVQEMLSKLQKDKQNASEVSRTFI